MKLADIKCRSNSQHSVLCCHYEYITGSVYLHWLLFGCFLVKHLVKLAYISGIILGIWKNSISAAARSIQPHIIYLLIYLDQ